MAPTLKQILDDRSQYPDQLLIDVANVGKMTLGEIRSLGSDVTAELVKRQKAADEREAQLAKDAQSLLLAQQQTANLFAEVQAMQAKLGLGPDGKPLPGAAGAGAGGDDPFAELSRFDTDAMLSPLAKVIRHQAQQLTKAQEKYDATLKQLTETIKGMAQTYISDRTTFQWNMLPEEARKASGKTYQEVLKYAIDNRIFDANNVPDVSKAFKDMTQETTLQQQLADAEARGAKKAIDDLQKKGAVIRMPAPGSSGVPGLPDNKQQRPFASIDEALNAAMKDEEIFRISQGAALQ